MTNDGVRAYTWDEENRLIQVRDMQTDEILVQNKYDGQSRRRERVMNGVTNRYVYDGWLVVAVLDGQNNVLEQYAHGPDLGGERETAGGIGGILGGTTASASVFYHYDGNGNVTATTDAEGTVISRLEYDPFGRILLATGDHLPRFQFSSKEFDETTGLNYYGYRFYSPELGRWPNRDPIIEEGFGLISEFLRNRKSVDDFLDTFLAVEAASSMKYINPLDDEINIYRFAANNPVLYYDLLGLVAKGHCREKNGSCKKLQVDDVKNKKVKWCMVPGRMGCKTNGKKNGMWGDATCVYKCQKDNWSNSFSYQLTKVKDCKPLETIKVCSCACEVKHSCPP